MGNTIISYLENKESKGATTESIADKFSISNRKVGVLMKGLIRLGLVKRYPKGKIWVKSGIHSHAAPMIIPNSFYELINK